MQSFLDSPDLLKSISLEANHNSEAARTLAADLSEAQLNWKPAPERWSIAQCLEHLAVATRGFEKYFRKVLKAPRTHVAAATPPNYKPTLMGGWLARHVSPEAPGKLSAPKIFRPADSSNISGSLEMFLQEQEKFLDFVRQADGIDYNKTRLRSPVTPFVRYSLADAFVITVLHGQRHLGQARRVREMPEFPHS
jgi:hypothetical protein